MFYFFLNRYVYLKLKKYKFIHHAHICTHAKINFLFGVIKALISVYKTTILKMFFKSQINTQFLKRNDYHINTAIIELFHN